MASDAVVLLLGVVYLEAWFTLPRDFLQQKAQMTSAPFLCLLYMGNNYTYERLRGSGRESIFHPE
jgi:hypothetical protein